MLPFRPSGPSRSESRLRRPTLALIAASLMVVVPPQLLGGVYPWGMIATAALALVALAATLGNGSKRALELGPLALAMLIALGWTALQAVPLPCSVTEWLAPAAVEQLRYGRRLLGLGEPAFCALSRDPGNTREEIVKGIAIVAAFLAASALSRRAHRRWVLYAVAASGVALAAVGIAHAVVEAERVFGWYEPVELRRPPVLSPLLAVNTLGGVLAMCVPVLIGIGFANRSMRLGVLVAVLLVAACLFMTGSRGAVGALFAGVGSFMLLAWRRRTRMRRRRSARAIGRGQIGWAIGIAASLAVSAAGWHQEITAEFERGDASKLEVLAAGLSYTGEHPWLGIGRGAFGSTFSAVHETKLRFEHAENFVVQWVAEWGYPIALLLLAALGVALIGAMRRARSFDRIGALAGVTAFALQNLVDLGLELVGVAVPAAALLAAAVTDRSEAQPERSPKPSLQLRAGVALGGTAVLGALVAVLAWPIQRDHALYLEQRLAAQLAEGDRPGFRAALAQAVLAHPAEPIFPILAASEALRHRDRSASRWINRGMQLAPGWFAPHVQAAEWLFAIGRQGQALLELTLAARIDAPRTRPLLCAMAKQDLDGVISRAPRARPDRERFYRLLGDCIRDPHGEAAERLDAAVLREFPDDAAANLRAARRELRAGRADEALTLAAKAAKGAERPERATALAADALAALGRKTEAVAMLRRAQTTGDGDIVPMLMREAQLHQELGDRAAMQQALDRLKGLAAGSSDALAGAFLLEAQLERASGSASGALRAFEQGYGITGDTRALRGIATTAEAMGNKQRAAWAYGQLCDIAADASACERKHRLVDPQIR